MELDPAGAALDRIDRRRTHDTVELDLAGDVVDLTRTQRVQRPEDHDRRAAMPPADRTAAEPAAEFDAWQHHDRPRPIEPIALPAARRLDRSADPIGARPSAPSATAPATAPATTVSPSVTPSAPRAAGTDGGRETGRCRSALIGIRCWLRSHATWQIAAPCLAGVITGTAALAFADGTAQRFGQVIVTAALVTIGFAWTQSVQDQRRRQQDLRFRLASGNLERADLSGTVLDGFTLWGQNLRSARLAGASADHALLSGADLRDASMPGVSMRAASLCGADLTGASAYRADLTAADLTGAIAAGTVFEQAVLRGARLEGVDLSDADLSGADLRGATHDTATVWDRAIVSLDTHLPEDLDLAAAGLILTS
jgi:hypothetical protein